MQVPPRRSFPKGFGAPKDPLLRFWGKVHKTETCWFWVGCRNRMGYGNLKSEISREKLAHRFSWELHNGPVPSGLCVLHRCDCPACVNPQHLFLGTRADNSADAVNKHKWPIGSAHWGAVLDETSVRLIRRALQNGTSQIKLARKFGVNHATVSKVARGETWRHVM